MNAFAEQYRQLLNMVQSHLLTEYPHNQRFPTDGETYRFFKSHQVAKKTAPKPLPQQAPVYRSPPPPPPPKPAPKPVMRAPEPTPKVETKKTLEVPKRERETEAAIDEMADIRTVVTKLYPQLALSAPPSSDKYTSTNELQNAQVVVVSSGAGVLEEAFLYHLAQAISRVFVPAAVVNARQLKSVLESPHTKLMIVMAGMGPLPLPHCVIPSVRTIFAQPELKMAIWQEIQTLIVTHVGR